MCGIREVPIVNDLPASYRATTSRTMSRAQAVDYVLREILATSHGGCRDLDTIASRAVCSGRPVADNGGHHGHNPRPQRPTRRCAVLDGADTLLGCKQ